ncbi:MAG: gliding motility-associated C-terminal domain-containing protein, partial [Bacteroidia bacterium]|nr:gliding motility-associated C-terminal domain-containing protein [Bacteroidia bacterium]
SDSTSQSFEIKNGSDDCVLKVYSGITRNGDGENEFMYIENIEQYPNNSIMVFTRWGEQVYTMKGYNNVDRTWPIEGELSKLSSNTYFYVLDPGDGGKVLKGWIELIK